MPGLSRARGDGGALSTLEERSRSNRFLAERIARLPEEVRPFFEDVRAYVHAEAVEYARTEPRPRSARDFKDFVARFLDRIDAPVDLAQRAVTTLGYRWPLPLGERQTMTVTTAVSAGTAGYGQTLAFGSALTATVGALTVGVVGELIELYALASARTRAYRFAGRYPGEKVIADDLAQVMGSKRLLAAGTRRHVGDELVTALFDSFERAVAHSIAVPLVGPARAGYLSLRSLKRVYDTPLAELADDEPTHPPSDSRVALPRFNDMLEQLRRSPGSPPELGWTPA